MFRFLGRPSAALAAAPLSRSAAVGGPSQTLLFHQQQQQPQQQGSAGSSNLPPMKMARAVAMEVNRVKLQYRMAPSPEVKRTVLEALAAMPLSRIQQLDVKTVVHMLGALEEVRAPGDHPFVREAAEWVAANAAQFSNAMQLAQALHCVAGLNREVGADLLAAVEPRIEATLDGIDAPTASKLLAAARAAGVSGASSSSAAGSSSGDSASTASPTAALSWQDRCVAVLRDSLGTAKPYDLVMMAKALHASPMDATMYGEILFLASQVLKQIPVEEVVQLVPLIATSFLPRAVREARLDEALAMLEAPSVAATKLAPADATVLYSSLRGFEDPKDPLAQRIVAVASQVPLHDASVAEALSIAAALGAHTPSSLVELIVDGIPKHFGDLAAPRPMSGGYADVAALFAALAACPQLQQRGLAMRLGDEAMAALKRIKAAASGGGDAAAAAVIPAGLLAAMMTVPMTQMYGAELHGHAVASLDKWRYADALVFVTAASHVPTPEARRILRDLAQRLAQSVHRSTPQQLTAVACAYGRSGVRNDVLCNAVADKLVADNRNIGIHGIASCLGFLAAVDYRNIKCFVELQVPVRSLANTAGPAQVINLIASYSKVLLWNLKLFYPLVSRAANLTEFFSVSQMTALLISVERVDVRHPPLTAGITRRASELAPTLAPREAIRLLSALSRYGIGDAALHDALYAAARAEGFAGLGSLELSDVLMAFVRAGRTQHAAFEEMLMPVLAVAPTASPAAVAALASAYSAAGTKHEELFGILSERTLVLKDECPAVTIAGILAAFARVGVRNDRLFIEMIARVRSVPTFGTPHDIVNVVTAYSLGGVWHMRLFTRLGERAMYLRGEFRGPLIAELLAGYARVEMKFDKLFSEFSPRVQASALTMSTADLVSIVSSYAAVSIPDAAVFSVAGDLLAAKAAAGGLSEAEKKAVMAAYAKVCITHNALASALSGLPPADATPTTEA